MKRLYKTGDIVVFKASGDCGFPYSMGDIAVIDMAQTDPKEALLLGPLGLHDGMMVFPRMIRRAVGKDVRRLKMIMEKAKKIKIAQELEKNRMRVIRD